MSENVERYKKNLALGIKGSNHYDLEHPDYDSEEEYRLIMLAWEQGRSAWNRGPTGIPCPRPARRPGRPKTKSAKPVKEEVHTVHVRLPIPLFIALAQVKGPEQSLESAILEILREQLGPLIAKPAS